jgi:signal transduction histidine kinase
MMTPINCIITFARAMPSSEKSMAIINIAQLLKLNLKDLLDRSLLKKGKLVPNLEAAALNALIAQVVEMMQCQALLKQINLYYDSEGLAADNFMLDVQRMM